MTFVSRLLIIILSPILIPYCNCN